MDLIYIYIGYYVWRGSEISGRHFERESAWRLEMARDRTGWIRMDKSLILVIQHTFNLWPSSAQVSSSSWAE